MVSQKKRISETDAWPFEKSAEILTTVDKTGKTRKIDGNVPNCERRHVSVYKWKETTQIQQTVIKIQQNWIKSRCYQELRNWWIPISLIQTEDGKKKWSCRQRKRLYIWNLKHWWFQSKACPSLPLNATLSNSVWLSKSKCNKKP